MCSLYAASVSIPASRVYTRLLSRLQLPCSQLRAAFDAQRSTSMPARCLQVSPQLRLGHQHSCALSRTLSRAKYSWFKLVGLTPRSSSCWPHALFCESQQLSTAGCQPAEWGLVAQVEDSGSTRTCLVPFAGARTLTGGAIKEGERAGFESRFALT